MTTIPDRVAELLARLTLDEKTALMHQYSPGVRRLGIPPLVWGLPMRRGAQQLPGATVFPQAISLGATWDTDLIQQVGSAIAAEVRAGYAQRPETGLSIWGPVVNLLRDPRWGRNEEGYSECPRLTCDLALAMCRGLTGYDDGPPSRWTTTPVLQHFLAYNHETARATMSAANVRARVLHEYDLKPFEEPIRSGVATGIMLAYGRTNGLPNHLSPHVRRSVRAWHPECTVFSDAWAPTMLVIDDDAPHEDRLHAYVATVRAGLDLFVDQDSDSDIISGALRRAVDEGLLTEEDLDGPVGRLLRIRMLWGQFDSQEDVATPAVVGSSTHRRLAAKAASEAIVLLRNEDGLLPLVPATLRRVAVVGQLAAMLCRDWYSPDFDESTPPVAGIVAALGEDRVHLVEGVDAIALRALDGGGYVTSVGTPEGGALTVTPAQPIGPAQTFAVFDWGAGVQCLRAEVNGRFVRCRSDRALANDQATINGWEVRERLRLVPHAGGWVLFDESLRRYVAPLVGDSILRVAAETPETAAVFARELVTDGAAEAATAAREADAAIVIVGNHPLINGRESEDRPDIELAPAQHAVVERVAAANPATVAVLVSSYPLAVEWIAGNVPAMLWTGHSGPTLPAALAEALLGAQAPAGRLPQTWPRRAEDLGDIADYDIIKGRRTYLYSDLDPLFPFGHGLTYSRFSYYLHLRRPTLCTQDAVEVTVELRNLGPVDSDEVIQVYGRIRDSRHPRPLRQLLAFRRVAVPVGHARVERFRIPLSEMAMWDVARHAFTVEPGVYDIMLGRSATDIVATESLTVRGEPLGPRRLDRTPTRASDFDDYHGFTLEDDDTGLTTMTAPEAGGWLLFRDVALAEDLTRMVLEASRAGAGWSAIEARWDAPEGDLIGVAPVVAGAADVRIDVPLRPIAARGDLYLVATGPMRLSTLHLRSRSDDQELG
ncbi:glycoside hydrolase family 3 C-terminal domain-containing protein [Plantactinospora mayteni]|uniref:Sugar hydrolase n=1 Tax=Plantactinospora mayteni TaxID=566021 RepID=A0ABQ4EFJ8_9ACTN|nr:glycoside hydrolase family 3 C-terminal domain-containing protein [Plantactinospora mayteni]GIG93498.1 sugar hydrolase [Plantactinospora mayteni]